MSQSRKNIYFRYLGALVLFATLLGFSLRTLYDNGYPLLMGDSDGYILRGLYHRFHSHWALLYSIFVKIFSFDNSLWWVAISQSSLLSALLSIIYFKLIKKGIISIAFSFPLAFLMYYFTTYDHLSNLLMSDILLVFTVLLTYIYLATKMQWTSILLLILILLFSVGHKSSAPILSLAVVGYYLLHLISEKNWSSKLIHVIVIFLSIQLLSGPTDQILKNSFVSSRSKKKVSALVNNNSIDTKYHFIYIAIKSKPKLYNEFLEDNCDKIDFSIICNTNKMQVLEADGLRNDFHGSNFNFLKDMEIAGKKMLRTTKYWPYFAKRTLGRIKSLLKNNKPVMLNSGNTPRRMDQIFKFFPGDRSLYESSKQYNHKLINRRIIKTIQKRYTTALYISISVLIISIFWRGLNPKVKEWSIWILSFFMAHTLLIAAFANVRNFRYSGRASFVVVFGALIIICYAVSELYMKYSNEKKHIEKETTIT